MLDPRLFEHVIQGLAFGEISTAVIPFGDGPDGGREATFEGHTNYGTPAWDGYGVIQAKFRVSPKDAGDNARWLCGLLKKELKKYTRRQNPLRMPDYLIIATNANLSGAIGRGKNTGKPIGKDAVLEVLNDFKEAYHLKGVELWDYEKVCRLLDRDENAGVRRAHMAWILPSDVLYELFKSLNTRRRGHYNIVLTYLQRELFNDQFAMLEQAGHSADNKIPLAQVFIDLPTIRDAGKDLYRKSIPAGLGRSDDSPEPRFVARVIADSNLPMRPPNTGLLRPPASSGPPASPSEPVLATQAPDSGLPQSAPDLDEGSDNWVHPEEGSGDWGRPEDGNAAWNPHAAVVILTKHPRGGRYVLIGGPGQGKTTVGQYICQLFRCALLVDVPEHMLEERIPPILADVAKQWGQSGGELPVARRLPFRIVLSQFAKSLDSGEAVGLLDYLALQLCRGSARKLSPDDIDEILTAYPSLIVLDGLDEVPAASNRDRVMDAVSNFSFEVATSELDVVLVATTRPQGYNREFSPRQYAHHFLKPLDTLDALDYGRRLARNRFGSSTDRAEKVSGRLERAARKPTTAKLMQSPLQVTILTLLVDRMGDPPDERWKLFNEYYKLIVARETERDVPTAAVLRDHDDDIHAIHCRVGMALQVESERSGGTDARLTKSQFHQLVSDYLTEEKYTGERHAALTNEVIEAATNRLVFLVGIEKDQVGFEIRSLQEFMAAEAIIEGNDEYVQGRLRAIAPLDHWRNVFLFAAGKIFAERRYLRDTVQVICENLNRTDSDHGSGLLMAGSQLALDLLEDGPARKSPEHYRALTSLVVRFLDIDPIDPSVDSGIPFANGIAALCTQESRHIFVDHFREQLLDMHRTNPRLWECLTLLIERFGGQFEQIGREVTGFRDLTKSELRRVARITNGSNSWLREYIVSTIAKLGITCNIRFRTTRPDDENPGGVTIVGADLYPPWLAWYANFCDTSYVRRAHSLRRIVFGGISLHISITFLSDPLKDHLMPPGDLPDGQHWDFVRAAAQFCMVPSKESLATALKSIPMEADNLAVVARMARQYPWPLTETFLATIADPQAGIADAVRQGAYGDTVDWHATESKLRNTGSISEMIGDEILIESRDGGISRFPYRTFLDHPRVNNHIRELPDAIDAYHSSANLPAKRFLVDTIMREIFAPTPKVAREFFSDDMFLTYLSSGTFISSAILRNIDYMDLDDPRLGEAFSEYYVDRLNFKQNFPSPGTDISRISTRISNDPGRNRGLLVLLAGALLNGAPTDAVNTTFTSVPSDTPQTRAAIAVIRILTGTRVRDIADQLGQLRHGGARLTEPLFDAIETLELPQAEECGELLALGKALDLDQSTLWPYLRKNQARRSSPLVTPDGWTHLGYPATIPALLAQQATEAAPQAAP
jgi:hypothetical protein